MLFSHRSKPPAPTSFSWFIAGPAGGDSEPEGPDAGAAPRPHQASLPYQDRHHERDLAEVPADGCADCFGVLVGGDDEERL